MPVRHCSSGPMLAIACARSAEIASTKRGSLASERHDWRDGRLGRGLEHNHLAAWAKSLDEIERAHTHKAMRRRFAVGVHPPVGDTSVLRAAKIFCMPPWPNWASKCAAAASASASGPYMMPARTIATHGGRRGRWSGRATRPWALTHFAQWRLDCCAARDSARTLQSRGLASVRAARLL